MNTTSFSLPPQKARNLTHITPNNKNKKYQHKMNQERNEKVSTLDPLDRMENAEGGLSGGTHQRPINGVLGKEGEIDTKKKS